MKIFHAFRNRHPACAAIIGFVFGPEIVMAYLGRGWLVILYLFVNGVSTAILWAMTRGTDYAFLPDILSLLFRLIGAVHGYIVARAIRGQQDFPWYARWYGLIGVWAGLWLALLTLALLVRSAVFQPFTAPSNSMAPTVQADDYLFAEKYAYGYSRYSFPFDVGPSSRWFARAPKQGDIVVFRLPSDPRIDYLKRVIGMPGDRVQMRSGTLYLNGQAVPQEPAGEWIDRTYEPRTVALFRETLPSGRSYLVADAVQGSRGDDTEEFVVPPGHYFMLGDNRDNSLDSRFDVGFVPEDNLVGRAGLLVFSASQQDWPWRRLEP